MAAAVSSCAARGRWEPLSLSDIGFRLPPLPIDAASSPNGEGEEEEQQLSMGDEWPDAYWLQAVADSTQRRRRNRRLRRRRGKQQQQQLQKQQQQQLQKQQQQQQLGISYRLRRWLQVAAAQATPGVQQQQQQQQRQQQVRSAASAACLQKHEMVLENAPPQLDVDLARLLVDAQRRELTPEDYELLLRLDDAFASTCRPASDEVLAGVASFAVAGDGMDNCGVCLDLLQCEQMASRLQCGHVFHADCIQRWLAGSDRCPIDNLPLAGS